MTEKKVKKTATRKSSETTINSSLVASSKEKSKNAFQRFSRKQIIIGGMLILALVLYLLKGLFVVAVVNNKPIWRFSVISQLEKEGGKRILDQIITTSLIFQEAERRKINVSKQETDARIKKIEDALKKEGQSLDSVLSIQGMTKDKLVEQITLQLLLDKMLGKEVKVSDKEIDKYIEQNKTLFPSDASGNEVREQVKEQLYQQKLSEKFQGLITDLQKKAKILYFVQY